MAWPKAQTAEEILGMKPEELKTKLDSAASKDDVKAATDGVEALKGSLAEIQKSLQALTKPADTPAPKVDDSDDAAVRVLTDPTKFVNDATKDVRDNSLRLQAQMQQMRAQADPRFSNLFAKHGKELNESAARFSIDQQAKDNFWDFHIRAFLGDKMVKGELREGNFPSLIGASSVGPRSDGSSSDPDHGLNHDVAQFLRDRGVPTEKAAKIHQLMHRDGEPITHENYFGKKAS